MHAPSLPCPQFSLELPKILNDASVRISPFVFVTNALAAFGEEAWLFGAVGRSCGWRAVQGGLAAAAPGSNAAGPLYRLTPTHRLQPASCPSSAAQPMRAGLNMAVFLLIGKTSALTMNIAGVVKDWLLIALSWLLYK